MTAEKPSEGAVRAYRALRDAPPLDIDAIGRIIDREAVAPAVRDLVTVLGKAPSPGTYDNHSDFCDAYLGWLNQKSRPLLKRYRHLIEGEGE